jgi:hypothetical protein
MHGTALTCRVLCRSLLRSQRPCQHATEPAPTAMAVSLRQRVAKASRSQQAPAQNSARQMPAPQSAPAVRQRRAHNKPAAVIRATWQLSFSLRTHTTPDRNRAADAVAACCVMTVTRTSPVTAAMALHLTCRVLCRSLLCARRPCHTRQSRHLQLWQSRSGVCVRAPHSQQAPAQNFARQMLAPHVSCRRRNSRCW